MRLTLTLPLLACLALAALAQEQASPGGCTGAAQGCGPDAPSPQPPSRESEVLKAKREVSQRQAELDKAMRKGDPARIDQGREQLAGARKALQQAVDDLDR